MNYYIKLPEDPSFAFAIRDHIAPYKSIRVMIMELVYFNNFPVTLFKNKSKPTIVTTLYKPPSKVIVWMLE
jgi:hypothetical protein